MKIIILILLVVFTPIFTIDYDLVNGEDKIIFSLNSTENYSFYINAVKYQIVMISLTMSYMETNPLTYSYIYEYSNRLSSNYLKNTSQYIITTKKNNELTSSFLYSVKNNATKYIALQFTPNNNIDYIIININAEGIYFLSSGVAKNITNLKSGLPYYFFLPSTYFHTDFINLTMSYMTIDPFINLNIYEYSSRQYLNYIEISKKKFKVTTIKNNELISSFKYEICKYLTKYIALQFTPKYNISYIVVNISAEGVHFLSNGVTQNITNLKPGMFYFFFLKASYLQTASISLAMNYMSTKPFEYSYIYEYSRTSSSIHFGPSSLYITTTKKENELTSSFRHLIKYYDIQYFILNLTPNKNMNYIVININVEGGAYDLSNDISKNITNLKLEIPYYIFIPAN